MMEKVKLVRSMCNLAAIADLVSQNCSGDIGPVYGALYDEVAEEMKTNPAAEQLAELWLFTQQCVAGCYAPLSGMDWAPWIQWGKWLNENEAA